MLSQILSRAILIANEGNLKNVFRFVDSIVQVVIFHASEVHVFARNQL